MKRAIMCIMLSLLILLGGCDGKIKLEQKNEGFYDEKNDITYVVCSMLAVRPLKVGEEYATDGENTYYTIPWQEPKEFICDNVEGISYVYRADTLEDITINNFEPVAAFVYIEGEASLAVDTFYAAQEYLPEELRGEDRRDDSELVYGIRDALKEGERVTVTESEIDSENDFYLRLLSAKYPGLYYTVIFYSDTHGRSYLKDRGTGESVVAPVDLVVRILG